MDTLLDSTHFSPSRPGTIRGYGVYRVRRRGGCDWFVDSRVCDWFVDSRVCDWFVDSWLCDRLVNSWLCDWLGDR